MKTKICKTCKQEKSITDFPINRRPDSLNFHVGNEPQYKPHCNQCTALKAKEWRKQNPDYFKRKKKIAQYPKSDRLLMSAIRDRVTTARRNNKRVNRPFNIDADYMYQLWKDQQGKCYLTGFTIKIAKHTSYGLSIDKLIPELGYVKGNVKWTCWMANRAKGDLSINQLVNLCKAIQETCRDYPEMEYTQVSGSGELPEKE